MPAVSPRAVITIVGGGFAGTALALELARQPVMAADIHLVEPRPVPGPGLAYSTRRPEYLLNVRAGALSARSDEPRHFVNWLAAQPESADSGPPEFASRSTYGRYLRELLAAILDQPQPNGCVVRWHNQRAVGASPLLHNQRAVLLGNGATLRSDLVVLALGNYPPPAPAGPDLRYLAHPGYHGDPWEPGHLRSIAPDDSVLLIGSGLTAVDVLLGLRQDGHQAPITVVSRHGRWPSAHGPAQPAYPNFYPELSYFTTVSDVLTVVRRHVRQAASLGTDWRAVLDALRPDLARIWAAWPLAEQTRFLRHLAGIWAVLRHRSPPQNAAAVAELEAAGLVQLRMGRVSEIVSAGGDLRVRVAAEGSASAWLQAKHVICCAGPLLDYRRIHTPLVSGLREAGDLTPDPLGLGVLTDEHGALLGARGVVSSNLFTLGASRRPAYFESTAVPELRQQATALAAELARRVTK